MRAVGIDRFPPGHDRGSSHGDTRLIRLAYYEHPDYVPLLRRAHQLWDELEAVRGEQLHVRTGLLQIGPSSGAVLSGVLESSRAHGLDVEELDAASIGNRYPGIRVPDGASGVFEPGAGFLHVESCVRAHADEARKLGAEIRVGETVVSWDAKGDGLIVRTDRDTYETDRLIVTAGAWARDLLESLGLALIIKRKPLFWFRCDDPRYRLAEDFPAFLFETPAGIYYGFPSLDGAEIKVAEHSAGDSVDDPLTVDREEHDDDRERVAAFLSRALPGVGREVTKHCVCLYTMSPDEHFIVDRHPEHANVAFAAGLSGHGFKFTTVLGEALVDLTLDGAARVPIEFFSCRRPSLQAGGGGGV